MLIFLLISSFFGSDEFKQEKEAFFDRVQNENATRPE